MAGHVNIVGIAAILWTVPTCLASIWACSGDGQWAFQCSITSKQFLGSTRGPGKECGESCASNETCVQFNWKSDDSSGTKGTCTIFGGPLNVANVDSTSGHADVCGFLISRVEATGQSKPDCGSQVNFKSLSNQKRNDDKPNNQELVIGLSLGCGAGVASLSLLVFLRMKKMCCFRQRDLYARTDLVQTMSTGSRPVNKYEEHLYEEPMHFEPPRMETPRPPVVLPQYVFQ